MNTSKPEEENSVDFHEAAIIDEKGNEIEITEDMVQKAIDDLDCTADLKDKP